MHVIAKILTFQSIDILTSHCLHLSGLSLLLYQLKLGFLPAVWLDDADLPYLLATISPSLLLPTLPVPNLVISSLPFLSSHSSFCLLLSFLWHCETY